MEQNEMRILTADTDITPPHPHPHCQNTNLKSAEMEDPLIFLQTLKSLRPYDVHSAHVHFS